MKEHSIKCSCISLEHEHRLMYFEEELGPGEEGTQFLYITHHLNHDSGFFKRIWNAIKYILKIDCAFGHYDETLLDRKEFEKLQGFLKQYEDHCNHEDNRARAAEALEKQSSGELRQVLDPFEPT